MWRLVEPLALFKLSNGSRIGFWSDFWVGSSSLKDLFPSLYRIALLPHGSVADHWDFVSLSWSLSLRRSLKEEEIADFSY
ncbi:putative phosphoinositide phosphatase SAC9 [Cucumis melo var. makuwa]|uniref:Phosphoinositide phosphatase SAC9 n=1 Tax=Cucumis melo var. makuwa TaxID=1194695 RepID=A0A5A7UG67_CUCMM|nr:putative phosphoinositide phosphatase SAC9 [Cucumis melo var. makuwa]